MARISNNQFLNIFLRVFVQHLLCQEKFIGQKLLLFYFLPLLHSYKNLFKRPTLGDYFQEKIFLVANIEHKGPTFLGFIARFASWLITGHKRPTSFGFIARSVYNFLVVITGHKGPMSFGVHCKKWE